MIWRPSWPEIAPDSDAWVVEDVTHVRIARARAACRLSRELHACSREVGVAARAPAPRAGRARGAADRGEPRAAHARHDDQRLQPAAARRRRSGPSPRSSAASWRRASKSCQRLDAFIENLLRGVARAPRRARCSRSARRRCAPLIEERRRPASSRCSRSGASASRSTSDPTPSRARFDRAARRAGAHEPGRQRDPLRAAGRQHRDRHARGCRVETRRRASSRCRSRTRGPASRRTTASGSSSPTCRRASESRAGGLGLGLAICKRLVEAHGGSIGVTRAPRRRLPLRLHACPPRTRRRRRRRRRSPRPWPGNARTARRQPVGARPGAGLPRPRRRRRRGHPDLPGEPARAQGLRGRHGRGRPPGAGAARGRRGPGRRHPRRDDARARRHRRRCSASASSTPEIPVVMLSVVGKASTIVEAMRLGAVDYLNKPFEEEELEAHAREGAREQALQRERERLARSSSSTTRDVVWGSEAMQRMRDGARAGRRHRRHRPDPGRERRRARRSSRARSHDDLDRAPTSPSSR